MSHAFLQRVLVRLLHDPVFQERLQREGKGALAGEELTDEEKGWLVSTDSRAFGMDPLRRHRILHTLSDEFKGSIALLLQETRSLAELEGFFSSPEFHREVKARGSLAEGFAHWLGDLVTRGRVVEPVFPGMVALEAAMARSRREHARAEEDRDPHPPPIPPHRRCFGLARGVEVGTFSARVVPALQVVETWLFEVGLMPAVALCDDAPRLPILPPGEGKSHYLLVPASGQVHLVEVEEEAAGLLEWLRAPRRPAAFTAEAARRGIEVATAREWWRGWVEGEILEAGGE